MIKKKGETCVQPIDAATLQVLAVIKIPCYFICKSVILSNYLHIFKKAVMNKLQNNLV